MVEQKSTLSGLPNILGTMTRKMSPGAFTKIAQDLLYSPKDTLTTNASKGLESVGGVSGLAEIPGVAQTPAGQNQAVIDFEDGVLLNFGPRTPQVITTMAEELAAVTGESGDASGSEGDE